MTENPAVRVKGRVVLRRLGEDCLLVPVSGMAAQDNCVFPLNETGVFIWECLASGQPVEVIAQSMAETFEVSLESARVDCRFFMNELIAQQLLEEWAP